MHMMLPCMTLFESCLGTAQHPMAKGYRMRWCFQQSALKRDSAMHQRIGVQDTKDWVRETSLGLSSFDQAGDHKECSVWWAYHALTQQRQDNMCYTEAQSASDNRKEPCSEGSSHFTIEDARQQVLMHDYAEALCATEAVTSMVQSTIQTYWQQVWRQLGPLPPSLQCNHQCRNIGI